MQFFTPFGLWSYIGVIISGFILGFIGRQVAKIGTAFEAKITSPHCNMCLEKI